MSNATFDREGFYQAIDAVRQARGVTWHHVFHATGVISCRSAKERRMKTPAPANRLRLATWAGIDAGAFERVREVGNA